LFWLFLEGISAFGATKMKQSLFVLDPVWRIVFYVHATYGIYKLICVTNWFSVLVIVLRIHFVAHHSGKVLLAKRLQDLGFP